MNKRLKLRYLLISIICCWAPITLANVFEYVLPNGLKLLVQPDTRAPVVFVEVWYHVGSSDEPSGLTGISHALEHMMFRGTPTYPKDAFTHIISDNGGELNAFTSDDYTAYYEELSADKLALAFQLEADRMHHLSIDSHDFSKEIEVVKEERRLRTDNNPQTVTLERFRHLLFQRSPYNHPVIGWMEDLNHLTPEKLKAWYTQWYQPNNATVVVIGKVDPMAVYHAAIRYFGTLTSSLVPQRTTAILEKPTVTKELTVKIPAKLPWLLVGYPVPTFTTSHDFRPYALAALTEVLSGGNSARLNRHLVIKLQIASNAAAYYDPWSRLPTDFTFIVTPAANHSINTIKKAIQQQIVELQNKPISPAEWQRIQARLTAAYIFAKDSLSDQGYSLGALESVGLSYKMDATFLKNLKKITPQQIQQVANEFFSPAQATITVLKPTGILNNKDTSTAPIGGAHVR